jgi:hypothetical protein
MSSVNQQMFSVLTTKWAFCVLVSPGGTNIMKLCRYRISLMHHFQSKHPIFVTGFLEPSPQVQLILNFFLWQKLKNQKYMPTIRFHYIIRKLVNGMLQTLEESTPHIIKLIQNSIWSTFWSPSLKKLFNDEHIYTYFQDNAPEHAAQNST